MELIEQYTKVATMMLAMRVTVGLLLTNMVILVRRFVLVLDFEIIFESLLKQRYPVVNVIHNVLLTLINNI